MSFKPLHWANVFMKIEGNLIANFSHHILFIFKGIKNISFNSSHSSMIFLQKKLEDDPNTEELAYFGVHIKTIVYYPDF